MSSIQAEDGKSMVAGAADSTSNSIILFKYDNWFHPPHVADACYSYQLPVSAQSFSLIFVNISWPIACDAGPTPVLGAANMDEIKQLTKRLVSIYVHEQ